MQFSATENQLKVSLAIDAAMHEIGQVLLEGARNLAPRNTGAFAEGLELEVFGDLITIYSTVDAPLPQWISDGTAAHIIGGEGQFLFNSDEDFASVGPVIHPGTAPNPWAQETIDLTMNLAVELLTTAIADAMM